MPSGTWEMGKLTKEAEEVIVELRCERDNSSLEIMLVYSLLRKYTDLGVQIHVGYLDTD